MEQEKNKELEIIQNLGNIQEAIKYLGEKIDNQDARVANLESIIFNKKEVETVVSAGIASPPIPPLPSSEIPSIQPALPKSIVIEKESNLEENIGVTWFARIGIVALILGMSFFLKYAFDNNWIGETGRVIIGIIVGIILLALGEKYILKYQVYGQITNGGGIAVLYLSIFAAFNFYHLIGQLPAFFMMIIITTVGIMLSLRYNSISLIIVSILGGFFTPILVSNGQNNQIGLLSYILLLDVAILVVSVFKKWRELNIVGFVGTIIIFSAWAIQFYQREALFTTMFFLTLFFITYSISSLIYNLVKNENSTGIEQVLTLFAGITYFGVSYALLNPDFHIMMGFFALILATYYFIWAYLVRVITPEDKNLYDFLAFLTIGFVTIAIPIQFKQNIITISWVIEAIILFVLGMKINRESIKGFGLLIFGLAIAKLFMIDSEYKMNYAIVFNRVFFTFFFVIVASYLSAYIFKKLSETEGEGKFINIKQIIATFIIVANILTIFVVSREITFFWDQQISTIRKVEKEKTLNNKRLSPTTSFNSSYQDSDLYYSQVKKMENKSSTSLSIFWLIYGMILMAIGIFGKQKNVRVGGMLLFILAILKLFFYDLWELGTLYRIISSISLGVVLLGISFSYQKYKDKLREII